MLVELIGRHYRLEDVLRALDKAGYVAPAAPVCADCSTPLLYECVGCSASNYPESTPASSGIDLADEVESLRWQLERANNAIATLHSSQQLRDKVAGVIDASPKGGNRGRYFCDGPEGHFFCDDLKLARDLVNAYDKDDDWTITDLLATSAEVGS